MVVLASAPQRPRLYNGAPSCPLRSTSRPRRRGSWRSRGAAAPPTPSAAAAAAAAAPWSPAATTTSSSSDSAKPQTSWSACHRSVRQEMSFHSGVVRCWAPEAAHGSRRHRPDHQGAEEEKDEDELPHGGAGTWTWKTPRRRRVVISQLGREGRRRGRGTRGHHKKIALSANKKLMRR